MIISQESNHILPAFLKLQTTAQNPVKNATNVLTKGGATARYATLDAFMDAVKPIANGLGIIISQEGDVVDGHIRISTIFIHAESGQYITFSGCPVSSIGLTAQQVAAATTYLRRYGLSSALGLIADEDDDGKTASQKPSTTTDQTPSNSAQKESFSSNKELRTTNIGVVDENHVMKKGKYAGQSLKDIAASGEWGYIEWLANNWGEQEVQGVCNEMIFNYKKQLADAI